MENTSGQGKAATIPPELGRWNWGAFLLNWIWGLGNRTYIALLTLIPVVGLVMVFVLGFKGNAWAWRNKQWESVEHFKRVQRKWTIAALILLVVFTIVPLAIAAYVMLGIKDSEIYQLAVTRLQADKPAMTALGAPVTTGFPWGDFVEKGDTGKADFSFSAEGTKGKGEVLVNARRAGGKWVIDRQGLQLEGSGDIRMIGAPAKAAPRTAAAAVTPAAPATAAPATAAAPATPAASAAPASPIATTKDTPPPPPKDSAKTAPAAKAPAGSPTAAVAPAVPAPPSPAAKSTPPVSARETAKDITPKPAPAPAAASGTAMVPAARKTPPADADARACLERGSDAAIARCAERFR